ncbi:hypothetical protein I6F11_04340 [Ensifer sp. NBAIM29]|nr:hypothetical protein [Ensifer sp. NBAIM29]
MTTPTHNPERIWLQSHQDTTAVGEDRLWCQDKVWPNGPDDHEPIEYIRADLVERKSWRCFHCDDVFTEERQARLHFGCDEISEPACKIKAGAEGSMLEALRRAEADAERAIAGMHDESSEGWKAYHNIAGRLREQVEAAENLGYERGLAEARALSSLEPAGREPTHPVYRFLVAGDTFEATDEHVKDDGQGWEPIMHQVIGQRYTPVVFKTVRRLISPPTSNDALVERLAKALEPFAEIADRDIGEDEADSDIFTPLSKYNLAPRPTVGMFRAARSALTARER